MDGWKMNFLLGWSNFRGYVSFREPSHFLGGFKHFLFLPRFVGKWNPIWSFAYFSKFKQKPPTRKPSNFFCVWLSGPILSRPNSPPVENSPKWWLNGSGLGKEYPPANQHGNGKSNYLKVYFLLPIRWFSSNRYVSLLEGSCLICHQTSQLRKSGRIGKSQRYVERVWGGIQCHDSLRGGVPNATPPQEIRPW